MKKNTKVYNQKLEIKPEIVTELEELQKITETNSAASLILQFVDKDDSLKQASLLKKIGTAINRLAKSEESKSLLTCLKVLSQLFTIVDYKNPARRALMSLFDSLPIFIHDIAISCLRSAVFQKLEDVANDVHTTEQIRPAIDMVSSLMENFKIGTTVICNNGLQVMRYMVKYLHHLVEFASSVENPVNQTVAMTDCLATTKAIIAVLQKSCRQSNNAIHPCLSDILVAIATELITILNNEFLPDCKTASAMALCLIVCLSDNKKPLGQLVIETIFPHYKLEELLDSGDTNQKSVQQQQMFDVISQQTWKGPVSFEHLCICHGVLTMVPLQQLIQPLHISKAKDDCPATILFDILFSDLCLICESMKEPFECVSAFKVLSLWTEQARNAVLFDEAQSCLRSQVIGSAAIPQKLLSFVWDHWEHPLEVIRYQTKAIFEHVVSMHVGLSNTDPSKDIFLRDLTGKLIQVGLHSRGIYGPLCCVLSVTGAKCMLEWYPCIPQQVLKVLKDRITAPHAVDFIVAISKNHQEEILIAKEDIHTWHQIWTVPIIEMLHHQESTQDIVHIKQMLSNMLQYYPESLQFIISHLEHHYKNNFEILVTCLKTARGLGLIQINEHDTASEEWAWGGVVSVSWLQSALCSVNDQTRLDALGLLCESPRTTEQISMTDISLLKMFLPLNMNNQSPSFRQQCTTHLKKLLMRMNESLRISVKHLARNKDDRTLGNRVTRYTEFLNWFANLLFSSLFPEASFARRTTALHLLRLLSSVFSNSQQGTTQEYFVLSDIMTTPNVTVLLHCLHDSYDVNKVLAYELLTSCQSSKLPFQTHDELCPWLHRIHSLLSSPRAVDASTASVILKLLIDKCPLALYLTDQTGNYQETSVQTSAITCIDSQVYRVLCFLLDSLKAQRTVAEQSLNLAASQAPMHSTVYCIREILGHLLISQFSGDPSWCQLVSSLLDECLHVAKLVSPVVTSSSPEGHMIDDDYDDEWGGSKEQVFNPSSQVLLVCCWRTMKEVALVLGDLAQNAPIATSYTMAPASNQLNEDQSITGAVQNDAKDQTMKSLVIHHKITNGILSQNDIVSNPSKSSACSSGLLEHDIAAGANTSIPLASNATSGLLTSLQVCRIGEFFTTVLLTSKHHGAFELAYNGFVKLCNTLWTCDDRNLRALPLKWLNALLADISGCVPSDVLCGTRRSAGVPFFVQAIVTTEPILAGRASFKRLMDNLLTVASQPIDKLVVSKDCTLPQVHARNILRALYRDTRLGDDVFPFVASGLKVAISGFLSDSWAVRNSSTLLFSALMTRIFGVKKSKDEHSRRNCMTGREFFIRFPELHPFLVDQLKRATETMEGSLSLGLHPSLYPVLVLLSRLFPSTMDGADSTLNMSTFVPYVIKCGSSCVLKTRAIAARAIVPLVTGKTMVETVKLLITSLPICMSQAKQNKVHGALLQIQHLTKAHIIQSTASDLVKRMVTNQIIPMLTPVVWIATRSNPCLVTRAVFLDISCDLTLDSHLHLTEPFTERQSLDSCRLIQETIIQAAWAETITKEPSPLAPVGRSQLIEICARISLTAAKNVRDDASDNSVSMLSTITEIKKTFAFIPMSLCEVICSLLVSNDYEVRLLVLEHLITNPPLSHESFKDKEEYDLVRITSTVLEMALQKEHHSDCLAKVYELLSDYCDFISFPHQFSSGKTISVLECCQLLLERASRSTDQRDGIICPLLGLINSMVSCHVYPMFGETSQTRPSQDSMCVCFQGYIALLKSCSQDDKSFALRLKAAECQSVALRWDPFQILGAFPLESWEILVTLLNDDDAYIRDTAARCMYSYQISTPVCEVQRILNVVFQSFYRKHPNATLKWILGWIIKPDTSQEAVTQLKECPSDHQSELDLLFERNSLNSYRERVMLALDAVKCLKKIATTKDGPSCAIDYRSDVIKDFTMKCVDRLQYFVQLASELDGTKHFYDILSNTLGLVVDAVIRLSNENLTNVQLDSTEQTQQKKLAVSKEGCSELSHIRNIVIVLISNPKMSSFLCHPVMNDAVKYLCQSYDIHCQY